MVFLTGENRSFVGSENRRLQTGDAAAESLLHRARHRGLGTRGRYTYLDLNAKGINGGRLNNVTIGLNWYLNTITKIQFNDNYLYKDGVHSLGTRLAIDF